MKCTLKTLIAAGLVAFGGAANAATLIGVYEGNDPFPDDLVIPDKGIDTPALYKCDDISESNPSCNDDYVDGYDDGTFSVMFDSNMSGTWSWEIADGVTEAIAPHYMVLKAGQIQNGGGWAVYELSAEEIFGGSWSTSDLGDKAISHISFYNTGVVVPLPATGLLLLGGLGGLAAMRRRKKA